MCIWCAQPSQQCGSSYAPCPVHQSTFPQTVQNKQAAATSQQPKAYKATRLQVHKPTKCNCLQANKHTAASSHQPTTDIQHTFRSHHHLAPHRNNPPFHTYGRHTLNMAQPNHNSCQNPNVKALFGCSYKTTNWFLAVCIVHCALCIVHCALCIEHCALCVVSYCSEYHPSHIKIPNAWTTRHPFACHMNVNGMVNTCTSIDCPEANTSDMIR